MRRASGVALGLAATLGLCVLGRHVSAVERLDADALGAIRDATLSWTDLADGVSHLGDARSATALTVGGLLAGAALVGPHRLRAPVVLLVGANVTTQLLQTLFHGVRYADTEHVRLMVDVPAPSGHATFSASFALAVTLAAPPEARRWVAAAGAAYAVPVAFSTLVLGTHFPSDVMAGWTMALTWLVAATGLQARARAPRPPARRAAAVGGVALVLALAGGATVGSDNARLGPPEAVAGFAALAAGSAAAAATVVQRRLAPSAA